MLFRSTNRQTDRQKDRQAGRQAGRQADRQRDRQTDRQTYRSRERKTDTEAGCRTDRQMRTFVAIPRPATTCLMMEVMMEVMIGK